MPGPDPSHWLFRFSADEWLAAADNEIRLAEESLQRRAHRPAITYCRRGAGMALNAILTLGDRDWGRSYMEHVVAVANDESAPADVTAAARFLRDTPPAPPALVSLGKPDLRAVEAARCLLAWARKRVATAPS